VGLIFFTPQGGGMIGQLHPKTGPYTIWTEGDVVEHPMVGPKLPLHEISTAGVFMFNWFTVTEAQPPLYPVGSKIGTYRPTSTEIKLLDTPTPNAGPYSIVVNADGVPFFTERNSPRLGSVDPESMQVTEYLLRNSESRAKGITVTSDNVVWYTDYVRGYLGRFDPKTGKFNEWASPSGPRSLPYAITNVNNIIWYTEAGTKPNMLVRFDPKTEKFQTWPIKAGGGVRQMFGDPDGSLWFTRPLTSGIAHVTIKEE
jgi:virginiamycin B lyase